MAPYVCNLHKYCIIGTAQSEFEEVQAWRSRSWLKVISDNRVYIWIQPFDPRVACFLIMILSWNFAVSDYVIAVAPTWFFQEPVDLGSGDVSSSSFLAPHLLPVCQDWFPVSRQGEGAQDTLPSKLAEW